MAYKGGLDMTKFDYTIFKDNSQSDFKKDL